MKLLNPRPPAHTNTQGTAQVVPVYPHEGQQHEPAKSSLQGNHKPNYCCGTNVGVWLPDV